MKLKQKIGFIGCGNMGSAIVSGLLKNHIVSPGQIFVFDKEASKLREFSKKLKVKSTHGNVDLVENSSVVLLAIKPQDLSSVAAEIKSVLTNRHIVISILAGTSVSKLKNVLGGTTQIIRAMPNLGAQVSEGITAITGSSRNALGVARVIFSACGEVIQLKEKYFNLVTAVSGSGPAYFFLLMELLSKAGENGGLSRAQAQLLAVQTALGASRLAKVSAHSPEELRKMVTSKKGTTEAALLHLHQNHFDKIFLNAINRAVKRATELGGHSRTS